MRVVFGLALLGLCASSAAPARAEELHLPLFPDRGFPGRSLPVPRAGIGDVRVQVFPHIDTYTTPQGGESAIDRVGLRSNAACRLVDLERGTARDLPFKVLYPFRFSSLSRPVEVSCDGPITVVREGARSYSYAGKMRVYPERTPQGKPMVRVVNHVSFDTYVRGVIPSEIPASWHAEALKSQAVAARTYGLWEVLNARAQFPNRHWDIDDTVFYQAYLGLSNVAATTDAAAAATAGQYLTHGGSVIKAYFGADSGGHTEDAANMFAGSHPYCRAKREVYDLSLVNSNWTRAITLADAQKALRDAGILSASQVLRDISVLDSERFPSGRASVVHLALSTGSEAKPRSEEFRYALRLRSNHYRITRSGNTFTLEGRGFGHGVGANQWGCKILADTLGWDYEKILDFYYEGTRLCQDPGVPPAPGAAGLPKCHVGN
jgi:stage II sporulation protein D